MENNKQEGLRLYFFVMYNLSGIQKGIQAGHAAVEFGRKYGADPNYIEFADNHKTFILLSGGGSNDMIERERELERFGIQFASFQEPDLNDSLSAIAFIVPKEIYSLGEDEYIDEDEFHEKKEFAEYLRGFRLA